jgi:CRISPR-associated protein Cmr4
VNPHIAIDSEKKAVKSGALWYEETLPPETLLYTGISASKARDDSGLNASNVLAAVTGLFKGKAWLQIGGNETVGMGWCAVAEYQQEKQ